MNTDFLSIQEAAKKLKVSTKTLRRWEEKGVLVPTRTTGSHRRYTVEQIKNFIEKIKGEKKVRRESYQSQPAVFNQPSNTSVPAPLPAPTTNAPFTDQSVAQPILSKAMEPEPRTTPASTSIPVVVPDVAAQIIQPTVIPQPANLPSSPLPVSQTNTDTSLKLTQEKVIEVQTPLTTPRINVDTDPSVFALSEFKLPFKSFATKRTYISTGISTFLVLLVLIGLNTWGGGLLLQPKTITTTSDSNQRYVLGVTDGKSKYAFRVNIPATFSQDITVLGLSNLKGGIDTQDADINAGKGKLTASNVIYSIKGEGGITVTGTQDLVISASGSANTLAYTEGTGISIDDLEITNTDPGSAQKIFKSVKVGSTSLEAGSNTDTIEFSAGSNISLALDTTSKKLTISGNGGISAVGNGLVLSGSTVAIGLVSSGSTSSTTASYSGLEFAGSSNELGLLQGCGNGEILKWDSTAMQWECAVDGGGASGTVNVARNGSAVSTASTIDFSSEFTVSESPAGEANIGIQDASTGQKGIAQFNSTNFSASSGTINTIQNINSSATPTFAGLTLSNLNSSGIVHTNGAGLLSTSALNLAGGATEITGILPAGNGGTGLNTGSSTGIPTISSGTWSVASSLSTSLGGTGLTTYSAGDLLYYSSGSTLTRLAIGGNGTCLTSNGSSPSWGNCDSSSLFTQSNGLLYPSNSTVDFAIGGTSTGSAKFAILNVNTGTPVASVSAGAGATYIAANGLLQTTNNQNLTLGGSTTGNITLSPLNGNGTVTSTGNLNLATGKTFQIAGTDVLTGNSLGTGILSSSLTSVGILTGGTWNANVITSQYGGTGQNFASSTGVPTLNSGTWSVSAQLAAQRGGTGVDGSAASNGTVLIGNGSGYSLSTLTPGNGINITNGAGSITIAQTTESLSKWTQNNTLGALSPNNSTLDLLLGGQTTASAKFAFLNSAGTRGAQIASISGSLVLDSTANIQTTNGQTLTLGGSTTGDIIIDPGSGRVRFADLATCTALETVNGILTCGTDDSGTGADGSSNWVLSAANGTLSPINNTLDFLLGGTSTASAKFALTGVATDTPVATLSASSGQGISLGYNGVLQTTLNQALTIGGGSTGNITISPLNGAAGSVLALNTETLNLNNTTTLNGTALTSINGGATAINFSEFDVDASTGSVTVNDDSDAGNINIEGTILDIDSLTFVGGGTLASTGSNTLTLNSGNNTITFDSSDTTLTASGLSTLTTAASLSVSATTLNLGNGSAAVIGTTSNSNLTFEPNGSGELTLTSDFDSGVNIGSVSNVPATLSVSGGIGSNALAIFNQVNTGDILTASSSGTARFTVANNGTLTASAYSNCTLKTDSSGVFTCGTDNAGSADGGSNWVLSQANGTLSPINNTLDVLIGGSTTESAKFAILNVAGSRGTQTASISGNLVLDSASSIQTTNSQTLTLGGDATGDIIIDPGTGRVRFADLATCTALETVNGLLTCGTDDVGVAGENFWQYNSSTGIVANGNLTTDLLLGGASTASARFAFTGVASDQPVASISASDGRGIAFGYDGTIQSTLNQTLTLGGSTTGNIAISPSNGAAGSILDLNTAILNLNNTTTLNGTSLTAINGGATAINFSEFDVDGSTGSITINDGGNAGQIDIEGTILDIDSLTFVAGGTLASTGSNTLTLNSGNNTITFDPSDTTLTASGLTTFTTASTLGISATTVNLGNGASAVIGTTSNSNLTLEPNGSGELTFVSDFDSGVNIGSDSNIPAVLSVSGGLGSNALAIFNQTNSGDIFTASSSGTARFTVSNNGTLTASAYSSCTLKTDGSGVVTCGTDDAGTGSTNWSLSDASGTLTPINNTLDILIGGSTTGSAKFALLNTAGTRGAQIASISGSLVLDSSANIQTTNNQTLTIGGDSTGDLVLGRSGGTLRLPGLLNCTALETVNGVVGCGTDDLGAGSENYWQYNSSSGIVANGNLTTDLLLGGTSTASARFAFTGVASDQPVASISASNGRALSLAYDGSIQTTLNQALTIGGSSTGNITLSPLNGGAGSNVTLNAATTTLTGTTLNASNLTAFNGGATAINFSEFDVDGTTGSITINDGGNAGQIDIESSILDIDSLTFIGAGTITSTNSNTLTLNSGNGTLTIDSSDTTLSATGLTTITSASTLGISATTLNLGGGASAILGTTSNGNLTLTPNGSGELTFTSDFDSGVNIGSDSNIPATLSVQGGIGSNALALFNQLNSGDILTASSSGTARFTVANNGTITASAYTNCTLKTDGSGIFTCGSDNVGAGGDNFWQYNQSTGIVANGNLTTDLLLGSTSTSSARFAVLNVAGGTPIASLSAGLAGGTYLSADGSLQTTDKQTLTLGGSTTGNIWFRPNNNSTNLFLRGSNAAIGNQDPQAALDVSSLSLLSAPVNKIIWGSIGNTMGTLGYDGGSNNEIRIGATSNVGLQLITNDEVRQYISSTGDVGIGTSTPLAKLDVNGTASVGGQLSLYSNPTIQSQENQTLTIGGNTTGDIAFDSSTNNIRFLDLATCTALETVNGLLTCGTDDTGSGGSSNWVLSSVNGTLSPINNTLDLLVGGTTSSSARFAVLNVAGGTPTASVSAGTTGGAYLTASGNLQTTARQTLTLGGGDTGNIALSGFGTGIVKSNASGVLSSSAVDLGTADVTGTLTVNKGGTGVNGSSAGNGTLLIGNGTGFTLANLSAGNGINISNGAGSITIAQTSESLSKWTQNDSLGFITPNNNTLDLLVGGATSESAKFAILGTAGARGSQTASLSGSLTLDTAGSIQTTLGQTLTIGGGSSGDLVLGQSGKNITLANLSTCTALETVNGVIACGTDDGVTSYDNFWQYNQTTGVIANGNLTTDLLLGSTATSSAKFAFINVAGSFTPTASISATTASGGNGNGIVIAADGTIQSLKNNTLTLGGSTTGNISLLPRNGSGYVGIGTASPISLLHGYSSNANIIQTLETDLVNGESVIDFLNDAINFRIGVDSSDRFLVRDHSNSNNLITVSGQDPDLVMSDDTTDAFSLGFDTGVAGRIYSSLFDGTNRTVFGLSDSDSTGDNIFGLAHSGNSGSTYSPLFVIANDGQVGIGTSNPQNTLDVAGEIDLNNFDINEVNAIFINDTGQNEGFCFDTDCAPGITIHTAAQGGYNAFNFETTSGFSFVFEGENVGIGTTAPTAQLHVTRPLSYGTTGKSLAIFDQIENQDIFTASAAGTTRFTIANNGNLIASAYSGCTLKTDSTGLFTCGTDNGITSYDNFWQYNSTTGIIANGNLTTDLLLGGTSTSSARFAFKGIASDQPVASISASGGRAISLGYDGTLQTTLNQTLVLGGNSTGNISLLPNNGLGKVAIGNGTPSDMLTLINGGTTGGIRVNNNNGNSYLVLDSGKDTQGGNQISYIDFEINDTLEGNIAVNEGTTGQPLELNSAVSNDIALATGGGDVGIGTTSPNSKLHVIGGLCVESSDSNCVSSGGDIELGGDIRFNSTGNLILAGGSISDTSDGVDINDALDLAGQLTISATSVDVTTGTNEDFTVTPNGNGDTVLTQDSDTAVLIGSTSNTFAPLSVRGGYGSNAGFIVDQLNAGDIIAASASGVTRFTLANNGNITASAYSNCTLKTDSTGLFTCGTDNTGSGGSSNWVLSSADGTLSPINNTLDLLVGGTTTSSAKFAVLNVDGTGPATATVAGNLIVMPQNGAGGRLGIGTANPSYSLDLLSQTPNQMRVGYDSSNYFLTDVSSIGVISLDAVGSGALFNFMDAVTLGIAGSANGSLTFNSSGGGETAPSITAEADGDLTLNAPTGQINIGDGSAIGDITLDPGISDIVLDITDGNVLAQKSGNTLFKLSGASTAPVASVGASSTFAAFVTDNTGTGDLFTASKSGATKFTVNNAGNLIAANYASCTIKTDSSGLFTCGTDNTGGGGDNFWQYDSTTGIVANGNLTTDLLLGSTSTSSAKFAFLNVAGSLTPTASISATTASGGDGNGIVIAADGSIQSLRKNTLTFGGTTTGNINLSPLGGTGTVTVNGTLAAKTSGGATIVVAASDSSAKGKLQADYVADGTDDDVTIETAIAALPSGGGTVVLLDGIYDIGDAAGDGIDITASNVTLTGSGRNTIIRRQGNAAALDGAITLGDGNAGVTGTTGVVISNLAINGVKATYSSTNNHGIHINEDLTQSKIDRVWVTDNGADGLNVVASNGDVVNYITVTNSQFSSNTGDGIELAGDELYTQYISISNNNLSSNTGPGIHLNAGSQISINSNQIVSNGTNGITFTNGAEFVSVVNNNIASNTQSGISLYDANHTITGNTIYLNGEYGILSGSILSNTVISSNTITVDSTGSNDSGIRLDLSSFNTIANNTIYNAGQYGIYLNSNSNNNSITGNVINEVGASDDGIFLTNADNNIITGNRIYDSSGSRYGINVSDTGSDNNYIGQNEISGAGFTQLLVNAGTGTNIQTRNQFVVEGSSFGKSLLSLNQTNTDWDIFTASAAGVTKFNLSNSGVITASNYASCTLKTDSSGVFTCGTDNTGSGGSSNWNLTSADGTLSPINNTLDILVGGTSTSSARFAILNIAGGTPTASVSAGTTGGLFVNASGNIQTTAKQSLTIGGGDTGNIVLSGFGTGIVKSNASGVLSSSAVDLGTSDVTGTLTTNKGGTGVDGSSAGNGTLLIGNGTGYTLANLTGGNGISISNGAGSITIAQTSAALSKWTQNDSLGLLTPNNNTLDLLVGGATSESAKFAILGIAGTRGTQTATLSGSLTLDAAGSIQTTNNQTLTIGGGTTGDLIIGRANQTTSLPGFTGGGTGCTLKTDSSGILTCGTDLAGGGDNFWQYNSTTGIVANGNLTTDFLLGSTSTSSAKFAVINIAGGTPTASLSAGTSGGTYLTATGALQTTANQTLTLGGSTTGRISFAPNGETQDFIELSSDGTNLSLTTTDSSNLSLSPAGVLNLNSVGDMTLDSTTDIVLDADGGDVILRDAATEFARFTNTSTDLTLDIVGDNFLSTDALNFGGGAASAFNFFATNVSGASTPDGLGDLYIQDELEVDGTLRLNNQTYTFPSAAGSNNYALTTDGAGTLSWSEVALGYNWWQMNNGLLSPAFNSLDLAIGGTSTTSAKFAFINVNSGTPTFRIYNSDGSQSLNLSHDGTNGIITSTTGTINIGNGAGNIYLEADLINDTTNNDGFVKISDKLWVTGSENAGNTLALFNNTGAGDILTASGGGTTRFNIANNGTLTASAYASCTLKTDSSGVFTCGTDLTGGSGSSNWVLSSADGTISPINNTLDLLVGGTATTSARFAVLNVAGGTPTASLSAGLGGGAYLTASGTLATTNYQALNLGNSSTGNVNVYTDFDFDVNSAGSINLRADGTNLRIFSDAGSIGIDASDPISINNNLYPSSDVTYNFGGNTLAWGAIYTYGLVSGTGDELYLDSSTGTIAFQDGIRFDGAATDITTSTNQDLTLNANGTGNINLGGDFNSQVLIGSSGTTTEFPLFVNNAIGSNASLAVNNRNAGDIFTASASGTTKFTIKNDGTASSSAGFTVDGVGNIQSTNNQTLTIGGNTTGNIVLDPLDSIDGSAVLPGADDTVALGSTAFRFKDLFLGPGTLSIICKTGDGCASDTTYTFGIDTGSGDFEIAAGGNNALVIGDDGNVRVTGSFLSNASSGVNPLSSFDIRADGETGGTIAVASVSGTTSFAALTVDNNGLGDLFTASKSGATKFTINNAGNLIAANYSNCTLKTDSTGLFTCGSDLQGAGGSSNWVLNSTDGTLSPINNTLDLLVGGTSTLSAKFAVLNVAGGNTTASVSAGTTGGAYFTADGTFGTTANQTVTIGGAQSGRLVLNSNGQTIFRDVGNSSVMLGVFAGNAYTGGSSNTFIGVSSVQSGEGGNYNTALGAASGNTLGAGSEGNVALGYQAGSGITSGDYNIAIGYSNAGSIAAGSNNIVLGAFAGVSNGVSHSIAIGASATATANNQLVIGGSGSGITDVYIGEGVTETTPSGVTINPTGESGSNQNGVSLTLAGGKGTGTGTGGNLIFSTSIAEASGSTLQTLAERMRIDSYGRVGIGATSPLATFDVRSNLINGGTTAIASVSGSSSFAALTVDNNGVGDIFTASKSGLTKFVISNSGNVGIGTTAPTEKLALAGGNFLHTASGNPTLKGNYNTTGTSQGVYVQGNYAYVADSNSLVILDISNPSSPTLVSSLATADTAYKVHVAGKYAYVAARTAGLIIIDISNPAIPRTVGTYNTADRALGLYVSGKYAFVADRTNGLEIIDISNPSSPSFVANYPSVSLMYDVYIQGEYAYLANDTTGLVVLNITDISNPAYVGTYNTATAAIGLFVSGNYAYIADDAGGLVIVNIQNPAAPSLSGTYNTDGSAQDVFVSGNYAYVADLGGGLVVIDISNRTTPSLVGIMSSPTNYFEPFASGKYIYSAAGTGGMDIVDINGIQAPAANIASLSSGDITVTNNIDIGNNAFIRNALNLGAGGLYSNGSFSFVTASGAGNLIQGAPTGKALLTLNQTGNQDIFAASASGTTRFTIGANGNLTASAYANCTLKTDSTGLFTCGTDLSGGGDNFWQYNQSTGVVSNGNLTTDLLLGGTSTASAKFAITNVSGTRGTQVATLSGSLVLDAAGSIQTTKNQNLTIGGSTTGNIFINDPTGNLARFDRQGDDGGRLTLYAVEGGNSEAFIRNDGAFGDSMLVFQADGVNGEVARFSDCCNSDLLVIGATDQGSSFRDHLSIGDLLEIRGLGFITTESNANLQLLPNGYGNVNVTTIAGGQAALIVDKFSSSGDIFTASASGVAKFTVTNAGGIKFGTDEGDNGECLLSQGVGNGAVWGSCGGGPGGGTDRWQVNEGVLSPGNQTLDFAFGGIASASAKFKLSLSGTQPTASIAGTTSNAALVVDNSGIGDIFTASSSGLNRFVIKNNGNVGIGTTTPSDPLHIAGNVNGTVGMRIQNASGGGSAASRLSFFNDAIETYMQLNSVANSTLGGINSWNFVKSSSPGDIAFFNGNATNIRFAISTQGKISVSHNTPLATFDVRPSLSDGGTVAVASVSGSTSRAALVVDNSGTGDLITASSSGLTRFVVKQNGTVEIGNTTNGITFDYLNGGPTYVGSARPAKTLALNAEYTGAILTASASATTTGSMTSDASPSAALSNWRTYYEWTSSQTSLHDYTVAVRVKLPADFSGWATTDAITIDYNTEIAGTADSKLDTFIYNSSTSLTSAEQATPIVYRQNTTSATHKTWATLSIDDSDLTDGNGALDTAGETAVIFIKMSSKNNNHVQIGDIILNYLAKF